jgi:hypothetical protein
MHKRRRVLSDNEMETEASTSSGISPSTTTLPPNDTEEISNDDWNNDHHEPEDNSHSTYTIARSPTNTIQTKPSTEANFRILRNLRGKEIRCQERILMFDKHIMDGTFPRGLNINIEPRVPVLDTTLLHEWEKIKIHCQTQMLLCLRSFWEKHRTNLLEQADTLEKEITDTVDPIEWQRMQKIIQQTIEATRANSKNPRRSQNRRKGPENLSRETNGRR